jgi:hypothetical protein
MGDASKATAIGKRRRLLGIGSLVTITVAIRLHQAATKHIQGDSETHPGQFRIIARTLIAKKSMLGVHFQPLKIYARFLKLRVNQRAALERDMRILPPPKYSSSPRISPARANDPSFMPLPRLPLWISVA